MKRPILATDYDGNGREWMDTIPDGADLPRPERSGRESERMGVVDDGGMPRPTVLLGIGSPWPLPPNPDGSCGGCGGRKLPRSWYCCHCDGRPGDARLRELIERAKAGGRRAYRPGRLRGGIQAAKAGERG